MLASLIALTLALLAGPVTIDEARLIAQEHAGTEMAPEPEIVQADGQPYLARFHPVDQERRGETHVVRLDTGRYRGSSSEHTPSPLAVLGPVTDETAIDIARAIAKERGAPRFDELVWRVDSMSDDYCAVITGEVPSPDPRFEGPLTGCQVGVRRADGSVAHYLIAEVEPPSFDDVRISGERAREIAVELLGPDTHVTVEPRLWYGPFDQDYSGAKRLAWRLKVGTPEYEEVLVEVDARTGEAGVIGYAVGTDSLDAPVPAAPASSPWLIYGGIALLCAVCALFGSLYWVARRR